MEAEMGAICGLEMVALPGDDDGVLGEA